MCGGTNTQCEVMSGVFTSNMEHGYHKVMVIPTGAMYINITEITKSRNYLGKWQFGIVNVLTFRNKENSTGETSTIGQGQLTTEKNIY